MSARTLRLTTGDGPAIYAGRGTRGNHWVISLPGGVAVEMDAPIAEVIARMRSAAEKFGGCAALDSQAGAEWLRYPRPRQSRTVTA